MHAVAVQLSRSWFCPRHPPHVVTTRRAISGRHTSTGNEYFTMRLCNDMEPSIDYARIHGEGA